MVGSPTPPGPSTLRQQAGLQEGRPTPVRQESGASPSQGIPSVAGRNPPQISQSGADHPAQVIQSNPALHLAQPGGVRGQQQLFIRRLIASGLANSSQDAHATHTAERRQMNARASQTAKGQGRATYLKSFGGFGAGARIIGQVISNFTSNPIGKAVYNTIAPLSMPLAHGAAAKDSVPGDEGTKFVVTDAGRQQFKPNAVGDAFRPFIGGLAVGNSLATVGSNTVGLATNTSIKPDLSSQDAGSANGIALAQSVGLYIAGNASAVHTVRNIMAAQAQAGMSLQEPIRNDNGDIEGMIITHQEPIARGQRQELAQVKIKDGANTYTISILRQTDDQVVLETFREDTPQPATLAGRGQAFLQNMVPRDSDSLTKIVSLGSTLAASNTITTLGQPAMKTFLESRGVSSGSAGVASAATFSVIGNLLLGLDFIPKFMTFTKGTTPANTPPPEQRTDAQQAEVRNNAAVKVGKAMIPVVGGIVAVASGDADPVSGPRLGENTFEGLAQNKCVMLAELASQDHRYVTRQPDGSLKVNADALRQFAVGQQNSLADNP